MHEPDRPNFEAVSFVELALWIVQYFGAQLPTERATDGQWQCKSIFDMLLRPTVAYVTQKTNHGLIRGLQTLGLDRYIVIFAGVFPGKLLALLFLLTVCCFRYPKIVASICHTSAEFFGPKLLRKAADLAKPFAQGQNRLLLHWVSCGTAATQRSAIHSKSRSHWRAQLNPSQKWITFPFLWLKITTSWKLQQDSVVAPLNSSTPFVVVKFPILGVKPPETHLWQWFSHLGTKFTAPSWASFLHHKLATLDPRWLPDLTKCTSRNHLKVGLSKHRIHYTQNAIVVPHLPTIAMTISISISLFI